MRKSFLMGAAVTALLFSLIGPVRAEQEAVTFNGVNLRVNGSDVVREGEALTLDNGVTVPYSIAYNGTNYLPAGKLCELLGFDASWDGRTRTVILGSAAGEWSSPSRAIGDWNVYHDAAYTRFDMIHIKDGKADAVFSVPASRSPAVPDTFQTSAEYKDGDSGVYAALFTAPGVTVDFPFSEAMIFELTNAFRGFRGAAPLTWNETLADAARAHSADMYGNGYVGHTGKGGTEPAERAAAAGYRYRALGENIAAGYSGAVETVHALINSPGHRDNILNPGFTEMGAGNYSGTGGYRYYSTQLYGKPR
ncbi:MAG: CAP domain-containing protein [Oscillospiraceae bacterium]|nr:CAP domain-containing protein [Oscillospiraceae bacterium]